MIQFQLSITVCTHVYITSATNMQAMQLPLVICHADTVLLQDGQSTKKKKGGGGGSCSNGCVTKYNFVNI